MPNCYICAQQPLIRFDAIRFNHNRERRERLPRGRGEKLQLRCATDDGGSRLDLSRIDVPGARFPDALLESVVEEMRRRTGDDCIGLTIGKYVRPTTFFALGFAWLASASLLGAFGRLSRYDRIVSTARPDRARLGRGSLRTDPRLSRARQHIVARSATDAFVAAISQMCRWIADSEPAPLEVHLTHSSNGREGDYVSGARRAGRFRRAGQQADLRPRTRRGARSRRQRSARGNERPKERRLSCNARPDVGDARSPPPADRYVTVGKFVAGTHRRPPEPQLQLAAARLARRGNVVQRTAGSNTQSDGRGLCPPPGHLVTGGRVSARLFRSEQLFARVPPVDRRVAENVARGGRSERSVAPNK